MQLANLTNLSSLELYGTQVTDTGLKEITRLKNLTSLGLGATKVTDAGLKNLANLKNLCSFKPLFHQGYRYRTEGTRQLEKPVRIFILGPAR